MFQLLASLKGLTKLQTHVIDNHIFRLHYKFTAGILALFSLVVTCNQFFGDPISCTETGSQNAGKDIVEPFCWTHNTYSIREAFDTPVGDHGVVYPGVSQVKEDSNIVQHRYYQWVCFVLALQAIIFYIPRYLWKAIESERVKNLVLGLNIPTLETEDARKKEEQLLRYLKTHKGLHLRYVISYAVCECLNIFNVIGQMYLLDEFLGGEFTRFGVRVIQFVHEDPRERTDPMIKIFPRMTLCRFSHYGPTGQPVKHDVFCILPLNIINEKIFVFLWFWFVILLILSSVGLVYRVLVFCWPGLRAFLLKARCPMAEARDVEKVTKNTALGDWFIIYQLSKNIESVHMGEILTSYAETMNDEKKSWISSRVKKTNSFTVSKEDLV